MPSHPRSWLWSVCLALASMASHAADAPGAQTHERNGYRFGHAPPADWIEVAEVPAEWPATAPGASGAAWRNWLIDAQVDHRGGKTRRYFDHAVEATTQALVADVARLSVDFDPGYQTLVVHRVAVRRDGTWSDRFDPERITLARRESEFESDMATGVVSALIVVDDVRPGDVVRYSYGIEGENPILGGMLHDEFVLGWSDPILQRRVRAIWPKATRVEVRVHGNPIGEAQQRATADGVEVRLQANAVAATRAEGDAPNWFDTYPRIEIAPRRTWAEVARWAAALYPPDQALTPELEQRVAQWLSLPDDETRAAAALLAVQEEVRYFSVLLGESSHRPTPPATTWQRRFGDCKDKAWLLATLLRRLRIDADPALVSAARGRAVAGRLPAASQFDHVVVRARIGGRVRWLDATLTQQRGPLAAREAPDYGAALPVRADTRELELLDPASAQRPASIVRERFEPIDGGARLRLTIETVHSGRAAESRRRDLAKQGAKDLGRQFADYYRRVYGELDVAVPLAAEDDEATGKLTLRESYLLRKPWVAQPPGSRVIELRADALDPFLAINGAVERLQPLWRVYPAQVEQISELVLPEGWRWRNDDETLEAGDPTFRYRRAVARGEGKVVVRQSYEALADHVAVDAMASHFEARRKALDALGVRLSLAVPEHAARSDRDRRLRGLLREIMNDRRETSGKER